MGITQKPFAPKQILSQIDTIRQFAPTGYAIHQEMDTIKALLSGAIELEGLMPWSSNYTFLVKLKTGAETLLGIYKPGEGERPLWDFPENTLSLREFASFLVSVILGWPRIPPTVLRSGPHGIGSVQLFIEAEYEAHYFNMRDIPAFAEDFRKMALFDYIVNNADRKGGHCLKGKDGQVWAIDHGLTFHTDPKLKTVIWEYCSEPITPGELLDLGRLATLLAGTDLPPILGNLINNAEIKAFTRRVEHLVASGNFPDLRPGRNVPYPPI
jgi:uncharacterized repeat protein (TIGR03843 family)